MRILILGAKGMLGQCLVRAFSDWEVIAWDRADLDITNKEEVRDHITVARPDIVINATAYNAVDRAEEEVERAMAVNGEGVGYIAEAAGEVGAGFVHFSTDYVFGAERRMAHGSETDGARLPAEGSAKAGITDTGDVVGAGQRPRPSVGTAVPLSRAATRGRPYEETDEPIPLSVYGRSKFLGEQRVQEVAARHPGWRWYIIRTSRLFGPSGVSPSAKESFVDAIVTKAAGTDRIEVVDEEWSAPTYVVDLAAATREMLCATKGKHSHILKNVGMFRGGSGTEHMGVASGIYHRTNDGACTWYGFARVVLDHQRWKGTLVPVSASRFPRAAQRPPYSVLGTTKLPPMRGWESALQEYLQAQHQN